MHEVFAQMHKVAPTRITDNPVVEVPRAPADFVDSENPLSAANAAEVAAVDIDGQPKGERERQIWAMERCNRLQAKAARLLKTSPRQTGYALQKNGMEVRKF
jgi:Nif-specific regulatory protein